METKESSDNLKHKIKIVFLGDRAVGKSSIISKFALNKFEEYSPVLLQISRPLSVLILSLNIVNIIVRSISYNCGIQQVNKNTAHLSKDI
jgi:GTPase SAR1 family protein